jgi:hypothetical protein
MTKKRITINIIFVLMFSSSFGQNDTLVKKSFFAIKTDILLLSLNAFGVVNTGVLTLEKGFSHRHSLQVTAGYTKYIHFKSDSWNLIPEYKVFISKKKGFKGFYTGLYLKYLNETDLELYSSGYGGDKYITKKYQNYGAGITFGFQTYIKKHLTLDFLLGIGGKYITRQVDIPSGYYVSGASHSIDNNYPAAYLDGRASINLGYKF